MKAPALAPLRRLFYASDPPRAGLRIDGLLGALPGKDRAFDPDGIKAAFGLGGGALGNTCFRSVRQVPPGCALRLRDGWEIIEAPADSIPTASLEELLKEAIARALAGSHRPALALSGGLDSALLLTLLRECGSPVEVFTLRTNIAGYDESARTLATARELGVEVQVIDATQNDFIEALPDCVRAIEQPIWNLHPVGRFLLARALGERGHDVVMTGDGADQVFAFDDGLDWLPLVGAMYRATGPRLAAPFVDPRFVAAAQSVGPDPDKRALRMMAQSRLPSSLAASPKVPRLAPPMNIGRHLDERLAAAIACDLSQSFAIKNDQDQVRWTSLCLLHRSHVEGA